MFGTATQPSSAPRLHDSALYTQTILKKDEHGEVVSIQPFDPKYLPETKYGGESVDPNAHYIPHVISEKTLDGEHISEYKNRQIEQQEQELSLPLENSKLKPMEP